MSAQWKDVERVLETHRQMLLAGPGVRGTAIGSSEGVLCIIVFVADGSVAERGTLPGTLEGIPVKIEVSGPFTPLSKGQIG
jgi:hypothetical protein